jgi:hypothetical protein
VGGRSLAFNLIGPLFESSSSSMQARILVGGVEKKPLVGGVDKFNMAHEGSIV